MKHNPALKFGGFGAVLVLVLSLSFGSALAQGERGTLNGIVTDQNGAIIAGADVTASNLETNIETKTRTTDAGVYRLPYLPSGKYKLTVRANGFQTTVLTNITLLVAQTLTVDVKLTGDRSRTKSLSSGPRNSKPARRKSGAT